MKWHLGAPPDATPAQRVTCELLDSIDLEDTPVGVLIEAIGQFIGEVLAARGVNRQTLADIARTEAALSRARFAQMFIEDCVSAEGEGVSCAALHRHYRAWGTHLLPHDVLSPRRFENELLRAYPEAKREQCQRGGRRVAVYRGLAFTPDSGTVEALEWLRDSDPLTTTSS